MKLSTQIISLNFYYLTFTNSILFDDFLPSFSQLNNSAFVESLVLRVKKLNHLIFDSLISIECFFHSNGFKVNGINNNRMLQGQDYTADEASLPSLTPIIFCE